MHPLSFQTRTADQRRAEQTFHNYSLSKVLRHAMSGERLDGFEAEVEKQFGGSVGTQSRHGPTITVPWGVLAGQRDLNIASPTAGGYLVGSSMGPAADVLRPYNVATRAGMSVLSGLRTDIFIPGVLDEVQFGWMLDETSPGPSLTPATGLVQMRPHVACGVITYHGRLVRGMPPGMLDLFVRRRLLQAAGALIDRVVLDGRSNRGTATADDMAEPLGLCNITGVQRFSAAGVAANLLSAAVNPSMAAVANRAGSDEGSSFVLSPGMRALLLPTSPTERGAIDSTGRLQSKATHCTAGMAAITGAYGEWSNAVLGLWGDGIEIAIDPFTGFKNDTVTMRCMVAMDVAFNNPAAFSVFTLA